MLVSTHCRLTTTSNDWKQTLDNSSNEEIFNESVAEYNAALKKSGYKEDVKYKKKEPKVAKTATTCHSTPQSPSTLENSS